MFVGSMSGLRRKTTNRMPVVGDFAMIGGARLRGLLMLLVLGDGSANSTITGLHVFLDFSDCAGLLLHCAVHAW